MTTLSPVTESDMHSFEQDTRNFFERLATTFVSFSAQANELVRLNATIEEVSRRVSQLQEENAKLRHEVVEAMEFVKIVEGERDEAKRRFQEQETICAQQQDTLNARDTRIAELERDLATIRNTVYEQGSKVTALVNEVADWKGQKEYWTQRCQQAESERDAMHNRVEALTGERDKLGEEYRSVRSILDDIRSRVGSLAQAA